MAVTSRKPTIRNGPKSYDGGKIIRSRRNSPKWPTPKARPTATKRNHRSGSSPSRLSGSRRPVPSFGPTRHTRLAITDLDIPLESRRLVLIDGENVAYDDIADVYRANRIYQAYQWFVAKGHRVLVLCPHYLTQKLMGETPNMNIEFITDIPDYPSNHSSNQLFEETLLQRAFDEEAAILSERRFEQSYSLHLEIVQNRVIGYTFFWESIFIPVDPYGRAGPWLHVILHK
uniref:RNase_Zc3h12a domain-containing protein n=1 Tax=Anopheles epiroticus TaxID=199890 RepID=A0A182PVD2_9DIPT